MCVYVYIYIYIYINVYNVYLVSPGNSLDVSVAFPSFAFPSFSFRRVSVPFPSAFPLRFRCVSVAFPLRFRSHFRCAQFRWASARPTETTQQPSQHLGSVERGRPSKSHARPVVAQWFRPRLATCGLGFGPGCRSFRSASADMPPIAASLRARCDAGPEVARTQMCFNISGRFPSRFRRRFRYVSVNVSVAFPLGRRVPDGSYPETLPAFPGPTKYKYTSIYIYIYIYSDDAKST